VDGRQPATPWRTPDIDRVLTTLDHLADALTPVPIPAPAITDLYADAFTGWRILARQPATSRLDPWTRARLGQLASLEKTWAANAAGHTLLHTDLRADNLLLTGDRVMVIDWPHACRGAAFIDPVLLAASIAAHGGPPPDQVVARSRAARAPPPGVPAARAHQAAQGQATRQWLAQLID